MSVSQLAVLHDPELRPYLLSHSLHLLYIHLLILRLHMVPS